MQAVGLFWLLLFLQGKMFFQHFFFILNLVRGFPLLEFFNTVIPTQIFLQSRNPHPASRIPHPKIPMGTSIGILHPLYTMELKQQLRRRQRERKWTNRFWLAKINFARAARFFAHFFAVVARLQSEKYIISRFFEGRNTKQQFSLPFPELWYSPLEFNSKEVYRHLTN